MNLFPTMKRAMYANIRLITNQSETLQIRSDFIITTMQLHVRALYF
jgi:hypothetical protein